MSLARDAIAELVIVRQAIRQGFESADFFQVFATRHHYRAQREVERLEALRLQHLAPEIRVDRNRLPLHSERGWIGQAIKATDQADFTLPLGRAGLLVGRDARQRVPTGVVVAAWRVQRRHHVLQKVRWRPHIGIADDDNVMRGEFFHFHQFGRLGIGSEQGSANVQPRVSRREFQDQLMHERADRVVRRRNAQNNLNRAGILLREPASQAGFRCCIATFQRFEQCDSGRELLVAHALVKRETPGRHPLPEQQRQAEQREGTEDGVQDHRLFLIGIRPGRQGDSRFRNFNRRTMRRTRTLPTHFSDKTIRRLRRLSN